VIIIPANLKEIGDVAFFKSGIQEVIFEKGSELETIGKYAFDNCEKLKAVTIPAGLEEIGEGAFSYTGLKEVIFEEGSLLEVIRNAAFRGCTRLQMVTLPPKLKKIGRFAFAFSGIEEVIFEGCLLEIIDGYAFSGRNNLKTINIPPGVVIETGAFDDTGCSGDTDIFAPGATIVDCTKQEETKGVCSNENVSSKQAANVEEGYTADEL